MCLFDILLGREIDKGSVYQEVYMPVFTKTAPNYCRWAKNKPHISQYFKPSGESVTPMFTELEGTQMI